MLLASIISFLFSHEHNFFSNMPTQSFVWILSNLWVSDLSAVTIQFLWYFLKPRAHPYGTLKATDTSIFYRLTLQSIRFAALKVIYISFQHYSQLQIFKRIAYLHLVLSICYNLTRNMSMKRCLTCTFFILLTRIQGHCHPKVMKALVDQAGRLTLSSRAFYNDKFPIFAEYLTRMFGYEMVLPMNTGAEGVETALKLARKWGYEKKSIPKDEVRLLRKHCV